MRESSQDDLSVESSTVNAPSESSITAVFHAYLVAVETLGGK
jgi:hypothetical protein